MQVASECYGVKVVSLLNRKRSKRKKKYIASLIHCVVVHFSHRLSWDRLQLPITPNKKSGIGSGLMHGHKVTFLSPGPQITGCNTAFKFIYMYYTGQCKKAGPFQPGTRESGGAAM